MELDEASQAMTASHKTHQANTGSHNQSQSSDLVQETADNVMQLPSMRPSNDAKVIESKTVCYLSNFDLNINEWFNEYENIEIFKINMKKNLGKLS